MTDIRVTAGQSGSARIPPAGDYTFQARDLSIYYGGFRAIKDVNLQIQPKKITAIIGPSGCGKSTLLRAFNRMNDLVPRARVAGEVLYNLREAALALGAPEWRTNLQIILPAAISGVVTGIMLAIARGVGETAPLLFTVLGNDRFEIGQIVRGGITAGQSPFQILSRILEQPVDGLTLTMWKYAQQPFPERVQQSWAVALVLMAFMLGLNILARLIVTWRQRHTGQPQG